MRNEELLFDALGGIDPALVEDAAPEKGAAVSATDGIAGRRKRGIRPGVLLAAAVLLIAGTIGVGADQLLSRLTVRVRPAEGWEAGSPQARTEELTAKELGRGFTQLFTVDQAGDEPYVTLSDEVMAKLGELKQETDVNAHRSGREWIESGMAYGFDTWKEAADFFDCGLLTSPLLEQPPEQFYNNMISAVYFDGVSLGKAGSLVSLKGQNTIPSLSETDTDPERGCWCNMYVRIPLNPEACGFGAGGVSVPDSETADVRTSEYRTPQGDDVQIVTVTTTEPNLGMNSCSGYAYFMHGSMTYVLDTIGRDAESVTAILRAVLDSLE